jgi:hypothetical protein
MQQEKGTTMPDNHIPPDEQVRIRDAMQRARRAVERCHGRSATAGYIATLTKTSEATVRAYFNAARRPTPTFVRDVAQQGGQPASELFVALGWLPANEMLPFDALRLAEQVTLATSALQRLEPHTRRALATKDMTAPAPIVAAQAVLVDPDSAKRFAVRLAQVVSAGRYTTATDTIAEFQLRPGAEVLAPEQVERLARNAGLTWRPDPRLAGLHPGYWSTHLELRARTHAALRDLDVGQYAWQGEPENKTWVDAAQTHPTHLLSQDPLGGSARPATVAEWLPSQPRTLVVLGSRISSGPAAAILAEALGWQFVPVWSEVEVTAEGRLIPVDRDDVSGRVMAWSSVARHIEQRHRDGDPWRAVVLLRPSALRGKKAIDQHSLDLLRHTPASVIYACPPRAFLTWWADRQHGARGAFDVQEWLKRTEEELRRAELELSRRDPAGDLRVRIPEPTRALPALTAAVPADVVDAQALVAWTALRWLDQVANQGRPSLVDHLQPGTLTRWRRQLVDLHERSLPELPLPRR